MDVEVIEMEGGGRCSLVFILVLGGGCGCIVGVVLEFVVSILGDVSVGSRSRGSYVSVG